MTFNTLYRIGLVGATIWQMILALTAEHAEDFTRGTYEMLWMLLFLLLYHWEFDK